MENSVSDVLTSVLSICSETQKKKNLVRRRTLIHFRSWSWVLFLFSTRSTTELGEKRAKAFTMTFLTFHRTKKKNNKKSIGGRNWLKLGKVKAVQRLVNQPININLLCVCVCVHVRSGLQSKEYVCPSPQLFGSLLFSLLQRFWMQYNQPSKDSLCPRFPLPLS